MAERPERHSPGMATPIGVAIVVTAVGVAVWEYGPQHTTPDAPDRPAVHSPAAPRRTAVAGSPGARSHFVLTAGSAALGSNGQPVGPVTWLQVHRGAADGHEELVASVAPPQPNPGDVREIVAGPGGMFVAVAARATPCESRLYRFRLDGDGHPTDLAPLPGGAVPALVGGVAVNPDGQRIAYATAPCEPTGPTQPIAAVANARLVVRDVTTGHERSWAGADRTTVGEIVWAKDDRTLGYTVSDTYGEALHNIAVYALDTRAPGTDLRAGRVLYRVPPDAGAIASLVMNPDGHGGFGMMRTVQPSGTVLFSFTEGRPMHVTQTIPARPGTLQAIAINGGTPRYACMDGLDAFGRAVNGIFETGLSVPLTCTTVNDLPS